MLPLVIISYLVVVNLVTYWLYWYDKRAAIAKEPRIPERILLGAGMAGGTPAAFFAQRRLRHKHKKSSFQYRFWAITVIQVTLMVFLPAPLLYAL